MVSQGLNPSDGLATAPIARPPVLGEHDDGALVDGKLVPFLEHRIGRAFAVAAAEAIAREVVGGEREQSGMLRMRLRRPLRRDRPRISDTTTAGTGSAPARPPRRRASLRARGRRIQDLQRSHQLAWNMPVRRQSCASVASDRSAGLLAPG